MLTAQEFGEGTQRFALDSQRISPFLSSYANAIGPRDRWSRVSDSLIEELGRRSSEPQTRKSAQKKQAAKSPERIETSSYNFV